jgi:hypothetical protein
MVLWGTGEVPLNVHISDGAGSQQIVSFTVDVRDVNIPPRMEDVVLFIPEMSAVATPLNSQTGSPFGKLPVTDIDPGQTHTFRFEDCPATDGAGCGLGGGSMFSLGSTTGILTVANSSLDREVSVMVALEHRCSLHLAL